MLSTQHNSSIDKRRQTHRRQQSLETPILAHQQSTNPQYRRTQLQTHRRGLSLDQRASIRPTSRGTPSPHTHHQLHDARQYQPGLQVSIPTGSDTGYLFPPDTQHTMQETQQQRPSQPGHMQPNFQSHLQQQLHRTTTPITPFNDAEEAKRKLLEHINWFQATYADPVSGVPAMANATSVSSFSQLPMQAYSPSSPDQRSMDLPEQTLPHQQPFYDTVQGQSQTVPNTPQRGGTGSHRSYTGAKHNRSQSFQYDAAPLPSTSMRDIFDCTSLLETQPSRPPSVHDTVIGSYENLNGDQSYASSVYSSSIADPLSPACQFGASIMPTVQEEEVLSGMDQANRGSRVNLFADIDTDDDDHLQAPEPYSPRQAALIALGDINASIEETGISTEQVNQFMSGQDEDDSKWTCLFPECGKKFGRKENIRAHIQTHLGDRQFKCNDCGKCFVRQHDLKRHAKIHSGVKPNVCPCGMSFARQDALTRHRQRGTCHGVLPGFEKTDDSKKKRGRPRKDRPDFETRMDKANRSRRMDAAREAAQASSPSAVAGAQRMSGDDLAAIMNAAVNQSSYYDGSSESGASDHGSPFTPAPSSEMDEMLFNDFVDNESQANCIPFGVRPEGPWLVDTPPTSPASYQMLPKTIAPAMLSDHSSVDGSSPASMDDVELALLAWRGDEHQNAIF